MDIYHLWRTDEADYEEPEEAIIVAPTNAEAAQMLIKKVMLAGIEWKAEKIGVSTKYTEPTVLIVSYH